MYLDKHDEVICEEEFTRLSKKFRSVTDLKFNIEQQAVEMEVSIDNGKRVLELAQKAASLYSAQIQAEKTEVAKFTVLELHLGGWRTGTEFRKSFDLIAVSNMDHQRKKATFPEENGLLIFGVPYRI